MSDLNQPHFQNAEAAREYLESIRWPDGPFCPHCGGTERVYRLEGKATRPGLLKCGHCRKQFTVTVGTVFERSKVPLHKWLLAAYLLCSSRKGISSHQLHRTLGVTYKTAWFMSHRIREAMREKPILPMGGGGNVVEVDESYLGGKLKNMKRSKRRKIPAKIGSTHMETVITLVERNGRARSFHIESVKSKDLKRLIWSQVRQDSSLMTDGAQHYHGVGQGFGRHETVNHHMDEYVRGNVHTNTVENYFSILKRGITGCYFHVSADHLKRYLAEYDFRYTHRKLTDAKRTDEALRGIEGKRLLYEAAVAN